MVRINWRSLIALIRRRVPVRLDRCYEVKDFTRRKWVNGARRAIVALCKVWPAKIRASPLRKNNHPQQQRRYYAIKQNSKGNLRRQMPSLRCKKRFATLKRNRTKREWQHMMTSVKPMATETNIQTVCQPLYHERSTIVTSLPGQITPDQPVGRRHCRWHRLSGRRCLMIYLWP